MSITLRPVYHAADPPPPDKTFTPERMADLAKGLERAIARIEAWGIDVKGGSRVRNTVKLLQEVASAGEFPEPREDLLKIAQAAVDAQEFIIIRGMLPQERLDPTANILKKAVGGTIGVTPHEAYQAQSELWVGAALSCASVPLGVLTNPQGPNPDYIVRKGTLRYAIEVKRIAEGKKRQEPYFEGGQADPGQSLSWERAVRRPDRLAAFSYHRPLRFRPARSRTPSDPDRQENRSASAGDLQRPVASDPATTATPPCGNRICSIHPLGPYGFVANAPSPVRRSTVVLAGGQDAQVSPSSLACGVAPERSGEHRAPTPWRPRD